MKLPGGAVIWAVITAVAVGAAGFGALVVLSALQSRPAHLRGLFDFASATWGDGLMLPLMTGLLGYAVRALPPARHDARSAAAAGLFGGVLGVTSQASWLLMDAPRLNWTLPRPHHFNAAGWYHAAFVAVICTVAAARWALAQNRAARVDSLPRRVVVALATAFAAGVSFVALLLVDAHAGATPDEQNLGLLGTVVAAVVTLATVAAVVTLRSRRGGGIARPGDDVVDRRLRREERE